MKICGSGDDRYVQFQVLMPNLGKYIRQLPNVSNEEKFRLIAQDLYNDTSKSELIQTAYSSYLIHDEKSYYRHFVLLVFQKFVRILLTF